MTKSLERIEFVKEIIKDKQEEYDFLIETDKESASYILTDMKVYEEILKDLEENEILKQSVKDTYDSSQEIIFDLKKENEELKENQIKINRYNSELIVSATRLKKENQELKCELVFGEKNEILAENEKLKKAIEILKKSFISIKILGDLKIYNLTNNVALGVYATEKDLELLKEVLE